MGYFDALFSSNQWCVPFGLPHHASLPDLIHNSSGVSSRAKTLAEAERQHILQALRETDWVIVGLKGAAVQLGVGGGVLQRRPSEKVKRHNDARSCGRREDMGGS
jgi:transcriptional regulator with GAF, ATPase, and Fis domain